MKKLIILITFIMSTYSFTSYSQSKDSTKTGIDVSANFLIASTTGEFKDAYDKDLILGFNFDACFMPSKKLKAWQIGGQFELFFAGSKKDTWSGIDVTTQSNFMKFNVINRLKPHKQMPLKPFVELSYGLNLNSTSTSYEIVDEASFWDEFLFDAEDIVDTETVKEKYDVNHNFAIGAGIIIKDVFVVKVKYNYVPDIEFVKRDGVIIEGNEINYEYSKSKMQLITIGVGFTFNTAKSFQEIE